jgi:hypothetical protein
MDWALHYSGRGHMACCKIHPEESFLFGLTRVATGVTTEQIVDFYFGGDYCRWYHAYPWFIRYLDNHYENIIGQQGLLHFQCDFPRFHDIIKAYCRKERVYVDQKKNDKN